MSKLGRRREKEKEVKTKVVGARLTDEEYQELVERCEKLGITPSQYLRHLLTKKEPPRVDIKKVWSSARATRSLQGK